MTPGLAGRAYQGLEMGYWNPVGVSMYSVWIGWWDDCLSVGWGVKAVSQEDRMKNR